MNPLVKILIVLVLLPVAFVVGVGLFGQTPVEPVAWEPPEAPSLTQGPYGSPANFGQVTVFGQANLLQPESLTAGANGLLYTGMNTGEIVVMDPKKLALPRNPKTTPFQILANTEGRPLGLDTHPDGSIIVADAEKGLLRVTQAGEIQILADALEGERFKFVDDVAVSADGSKAWFSDASSKFGLNDVAKDIIEHGGHGRLLEYDFESKQTRVLLDGLQFANGVEVSPDGRFVLLTETGSYQIVRYWLEGPKTGQSELFAVNLPGFPDNVRADGQGRFWVAIPSLRDPLVDKLAPHPGVRRVVAKLLEYLEFPVQPTATVLAFSADGQLLEQYREPQAQGYYYVTQATPVGKRLYLNSVYNNGMAWMPLP